MPPETEYHVPVMVEEVLSMLRPERGGLFLDGTLGGGGHARALLERGPEARLVGVDRDPDALRIASERLAPFGDRARVVRSNFAEAVESAGLPAGSLAGALLDLGVSSWQIDAAERGFTFRPGAPLDMRMAGSSGSDPDAAELLNTLPEDDLSRLFRRFGEEPRSRRLARAVVEMRETAPLRSSDDLLEAIARALGPRATAQDRARIFQALRIVVNAEIEALERALPSLRDALHPGGVLAVLSYHSLEDRIVKDRFREWSRTCVCPPRLPVCVCGGEAPGELLTRKAVFAGEAEVARNPRARSARLRAWRRR
jgi:16S rRNA (cytosine1402-N4)-methyltransferase